MSDKSAAEIVQSLDIWASRMDRQTHGDEVRILAEAADAIEKLAGVAQYVVEHATIETPVELVQMAESALGQARRNRPDGLSP